MFLMSVGQKMFTKSLYINSIKYLNGNRKSLVDKLLIFAKMHKNIINDDSIRN